MSALRWARDVESLYAEAQRRLERGKYGLVAAALFDEVERQHPYSPWARPAQLMTPFSYYIAPDYIQGRSRKRAAGSRRSHRATRMRSYAPNTK